MRSAARSRGAMTAATATPRAAARWIISSTWPRIVREHHATDRNLPRTLESIEDYFHEFCPDCGTEEMEEEGESRERRPPTLIEALPNVEDLAINLAECLDELEDEQRRFVDVNSQAGRSRRIQRGGLRQRLSIERRRFYRVLERALEALRDCLTAKAADGFGGPTGYRSSQG